MTEAEVTRYLIDNKILFISSEKTLFHTETRMIKIIKSTESRCLLLLLEKQGVVVSQNEAMAFAWGEKHREISFNTFYQCILMLRKTFAQFDASGPVITTIPRKGVTVDKSVSVETVLAQDYVEVEPAFISDVAGVAIAHSTKRSRFSDLKLSLTDMMILLTTTIFSISLIWPTSKNVDFFAGYEVAGMLDNKCQYYFNSDTDDHARHQLFLHQNLELCPKGKVLYITAYNSTRNISAISCNSPINTSSVNYCRSYYYPEIPEK